MISEEYTKTISKGMLEAFPGSSPRINAKVGGGAYGITTVVPVITPANFKGLSDLVEHTKTKVTLKRSGTGISILIN